MKRHTLPILGFLLVAIASVAMAAGRLPYTKSTTPVAIQNLTGLSPAPAGSSCTTTTGTKGAIATVTPGASYIGLKWAATDATGAAVVVKRYLNSNTAYMPESGGTLALNGSISSVAFKFYSSGTSKTYTVCSELQ